MITPLHKSRPTAKQTFALAQRLQTINTIIANLTRVNTCLPARKAKLIEQKIADMTATRYNVNNEYKHAYMNMDNQAKIAFHMLTDSYYPTA